MLTKTTIEIKVEGLSQKFDEKSTPDAKLVRADNVEVDKAAQLNKRRGYRLIDVTATDINNDAPDQLYTKAAIRADELVLFSNHTFAVSSAVGDVISTYLVRRGPVIRGAYRLRTIVAGPGQSVV